jgi:hypothetical protein
LLDQLPGNTFGEAEVWGRGSVGRLIVHPTKLGLSLGALSRPGYFCLYIKTVREIKCLIHVDIGRLRRNT